jgi:quercetin dioxygenase-like cupin family protein
MADKVLFPEMLERLPDIDINLPGVKGKLLQGQAMQVVFFDVENTGDIPPHHHQAQWGVILEGEAEMTIDGQIQTLRQGDSYFIPAGAVHSIRILSPMKALDIFDEAERYRPKQKK